MSRKVLVVDDEKLIVKGIRFNLEQDGMEVDCAYDGEEAVEKAKENKYDIILLDLMLPKMDGLEVCQQIREFSNVPIVMLTAKGDESDELMGFDLGVDEYIAKPFSPKILVARVEAILRRTGRSESEETLLEMGGIFLDKSAHQVTIGGKPVELSYKEFELLNYFMENAGIALSRERILDAVWSNCITVFLDILDFCRRCPGSSKTDPEVLFL